MIKGNILGYWLVCLLRSKYLRALKDLTRNYFAIKEEIDLCWRANNKGFSGILCW